MLEDFAQQFDLLRRMAVRVPRVRPEISDRHKLRVGAVNFHGTFNFRIRHTKGGLMKDLLISAGQKDSFHHPPARRGHQHARRWARR
jgi:hypothetical protein